MFDFCVASIALIVLSIPMVIIAILVKTISPGPALFRQKRYGVRGQPIEVFKFRSMTVHKAWSPSLDIKIMLLTVVKRLRDKNVY